MPNQYQTPRYGQVVGSGARGGLLVTTPDGVKEVFYTPRNYRGSGGGGGSGGSVPVTPDDSAQRAEEARLQAEAQARAQAQAEAQARAQAQAEALAKQRLASQQSTQTAINVSAMALPSNLSGRKGTEERGTIINYNPPRFQPKEEVYMTPNRLIAGQAVPVTAGDIFSLYTGGSFLKAGKVVTGAKLLFSEPITKGSQAVIEKVFPRPETPTGFALNTEAVSQVGRGTLMLASTPLTGLSYAKEFGQSVISSPVKTGEETLKFAKEYPYEFGTVSYGLGTSLLQDLSRIRIENIGAKVPEVKTPSSLVFGKDIPAIVKSSDVPRIYLSEKPLIKFPQPFEFVSKKLSSISQFGATKGEPTVFKEPGRGEVPGYIAKDLKENPIGIGEIKLKDTPSQLSDVKMQLDLTGKDIVIAHVTGGKLPFKYNLFKRESSFEVTPQSGNTALRTFAGGIEQGLFFAPQELGYKVPYNVELINLAKEIKLEPAIYPELPKISNKAMQVVVETAKADGGIIGGSFAQKAQFPKAREFADIDIIVKNPKKFGERALKELEKEFPNEYELVIDKNKKYGEYGKAMIIEKKTGIKISEAERTVEGKDLFKDVQKNFIEVENTNLVSATKLLDDKLKMIQETQKEKAYGDVEILTGKKIKSEELKEPSIKPGTPQAYIYYAGLGKSTKTSSILDLISGKTRISSGKPTILIAKETISKVSPKLLEPVTNLEIKNILKDLERVKRGEFKGINPRDKSTIKLLNVDIKQLALHKRLSTKLNIPGTTQPGVGALSGLRPEFEAIIPGKTTFVKYPTSLGSKVSKLFGYGKIKTKEGIFDVVYGKIKKEPIKKIVSNSNIPGKADSMNYLRELKRTIELEDYYRKPVFESSNIKSILSSSRSRGFSSDKSFISISKGKSSPSLTSGKSPFSPTSRKSSPSPFSPASPISTISSGSSFGDSYSSETSTTKSPPPYYPPKSPPPYLNEPPIIRRNKEKEKARRRALAYSVFFKRRGKFVPVSSGLPRGRALQLASQRVQRELSRQFKIVQSGTTSMEDIYFRPSENIFRDYRIVRGKKVPLNQFQFIQKTSSLLKTPEEKELIRQARLMRAI